VEPLDFDPDGPDPDEHVITRHDVPGMFCSARCSCGWEADSDNSYDLDEEIGKHEEAELGERRDVYLED
jgi:hypothetical protein